MIEESPYLALKLCAIDGHCVKLPLSQIRLHILFSDRINPRVQFEGGNNSRAGTIYFEASASVMYSMHVIVVLAHGIHVLIHKT